MLNFCCPVCKEELKLDGRTYRCINNHCFDCAKQGYVNLLQSNKSKSKRHGDDKLMIEARTEFLNTDSYKPLCDLMCELLQKYIPQNACVLDAGCGDCYYTEKIEKAELAPIETPRPSAAYSAAMYRVKKGDSLAGIAKRYHISVDELRAANQLEGDNIRIGQQLNIKRVESEEIRKEREIELYTVKSGDTLHDLAKQFGISVSMIRAQNNLSSTKLSIGQKLSIPKRKHG